MLHDAENQLTTDSQAFTGTSPVLGTNAFDTQKASADPSIGSRLALMFYPASVTAGGATGFTIEVIQSASSNLGTPDVLASVTVPNATLTALAADRINNFLELPIPQGSISKRWLGMRVTATGGTPSGSSELVGTGYLVQQKDIPYYKSFPKVVTP